MVKASVQALQGSKIATVDQAVSQTAAFKRCCLQQEAAAVALAQCGACCSRLLAFSAVHYPAHTVHTLGTCRTV